MRRLTARMLVTMAVSVLLYELISRFTSFAKPFFVFIIAAMVIANQIWKLDKHHHWRKDEKSR
jgi:Na+/glutamate symporter